MRNSWKKDYEWNKPATKTEDRVADRVVVAMKAYHEQVISELIDLHDEEMAILEGRKETPVTWKSISRRLKTVDKEVGKIKYKIQ